jgi:uncharacterized repeat protein (TIGR03803 family)
MASSIFVFCLAVALAAPAQTFTSLASFDGTNGINPTWGALAQGIDGNFYGTAALGGTGNGTVFKVTAGGTLTVLYEFTNGADGSHPSQQLVLATNGNFYGTDDNGGLGYGEIFEVTPAGKLTTLFEFNFSQGANSNSVLLQATNGIFYGTTVNGGLAGCGPNRDGCGVIFEMTPQGTLTTLHDFDFADGWDPQNAPLVQATDGNLYGVTAGGGSSSNCPHNCGTVFKISPSGSFVSLRSFDGTDGGYPTGGLVQGTDGNLYGTTLIGGPNGDGTIFKITPGVAMTTLHNFNGTDGLRPYGLVQATDGNFYGTTFEGGANGVGTVFEITPAGTLTKLHDFNGTDGAKPYSTLLQATNGMFYGTTYAGGTSNDGTIFSLSVGLTPFVSFVQGSGIIGYAVEILGRGFTGTTAVSFNGTPATFTAQSDTYLTATVPAGATTGFVSVTTPGGTLASNKIFHVTPQVLSFSPTSGPVGTNVVVTGESLTGATGVAFGGVKTTSITVNSDTQITVNVPTGAKTGVIAVQTPGGSAQSTATFTVTP